MKTRVEIQIYNICFFFLTNEKAEQRATKSIDIQNFCLFGPMRSSPIYNKSL